MDIDIEIFRNENEPLLVNKNKARIKTGMDKTFFESLILAQDERWRRA